MENDKKGNKKISETSFHLRSNLTAFWVDPVATEVQFF